MKILVTGGGGYLGSVLCPMLVSHGHKVYIVDDLSHGIIPNRCNRFYEVTICDFQTINEILKQVECVVHLAGIVGDGQCAQNPQRANEINVEASRNLIANSSGKKFIFASSCSVYGYNEGIVSETSPTNPISLYAQTKLITENDLKNYANSTIFRMATLYGLSPRMRFDLVVNLFIAKAVIDEKIQLFGGNQFRPLIHIRDAARAYVEAIENDIKGTYNLASTNMTINDLSKMIADKFGIEIEHYDKEHDKRSYVADIGKYRRDFTTIPLYSIEFAMREIGAFGNLKNYNNRVYHNWLEQ